MYFIFSLGCTEYFLFSAMAYDCYLATCYPLHYSTIMNSTSCLLSWPFAPGIDSLIILSCTDTYVIEMAAFIISIIVILGLCSITLVSYIYTLSTILRIPSAQGRQKAFSTCSSPLTLVIIWYSSTVFLYVRPSRQNALDMNKTVNTLNTIVTPLFNLFIDSLRNKEVKEALWKVFSGT
ncbi:unnamed protein product [Natator depressus]